MPIYLGLQTEMPSDDGSVFIKPRLQSLHLPLFFIRSSFCCNLNSFNSLLTPPDSPSSSFIYYYSHFYGSSQPLQCLCTVMASRSAVFLRSLLSAFGVSSPSGRSSVQRVAFVKAGDDGRGKPVTLKRTQLLQRLPPGLWRQRAAGRPSVC